MSHILSLKWLHILRLSPSHCWECVLDWCPTHIITRVLGTLTSVLWGNKLWVCFRGIHIWLEPHDILYKTLILRLVGWRWKRLVKEGREGNGTVSYMYSSVASLRSISATGTLMYLNSHYRVINVFCANSTYPWPFDVLVCFPQKFQD
jgi:hypothetical protein